MAHLTVLFQQAKGVNPLCIHKSKRNQGKWINESTHPVFFFAFSLCSQQHREAGKIVKDQDELFVLRGQDSEGAGWGAKATGLREWRKLKDCWRCKDANSHKTWESTSTLHICRDLQKERGDGWRVCELEGKTVKSVRMLKGGGY